MRDLLLGRAPKDFDVATDARPDRVMRVVPERPEQVGAHFGVVLVRENTSQVEVATFRSDASYSDGRRPDAVHFETDPRQDVLRRDFTINALLLDPETDEVLDFTGGREDLRRAADPGDRRSGSALSGRPSAADPRGAFRGAAGLRNRTGHLGAIQRLHAPDPERLDRNACATKWRVS